jgi:hypothetical protein
LSAALTLSCSIDPAVATPERTDDETAVLAAVERMFEAMTSRDAGGARAVLAGAPGMVRSPARPRDTITTNAPITPDSSCAPQG